MNPRSLLFARYQSSSPRALKILPFFSVWLRRALGFLTLSRTLLDSLVPPRDALLGAPLLTSLPRTRRIRSSSVAAVKYIEMPDVVFRRAAIARPASAPTTLPNRPRKLAVRPCISLPCSPAGGRMPSRRGGRRNEYRV